MIPAEMDEARRWTALRGWRWDMPGARFGRIESDGSWFTLRATDRARPAPNCDWLPDITDPATRGCLLALAREITGQPRLSASYSSASMCWFCSSGLAGDTEDKTWLITCEAHESKVTS